MRSLILIASILLAGPQTGGWGFGGNPRPNTSSAMFEAFGLSGAGIIGGACTTTAPTGSRGEVITFTRASSATCTKTASSGFATTGIANGDLVVLSSNQARVEYDANGVLGLLFEESRTNKCLRSAELCNAAWADVGTPACASDAATGPFGTTTMDTITDNDGSAFEGRSQSIATTSATQHTISVYVKSVSGATAASITMVGTGSSTGDCTGSATGLSTTTSTRISCTSPAAYAGTLTSVTVTVRFGTVVADQGTLAIEGFQHEENAVYETSYIPTTSASATRSADSSTFGINLAPLASTGSAAITVTPEVDNGTSMTGGLLVMNTAGRILYNVGSTMRAYDGTNEPTVNSLMTFNSPKRYWSSWSGSALVVANSTDSLTTNGTFDGTMNTTGPLAFGASSVIGLTANWIVSRVCIDPNPARCR